MLPRNKFVKLSVPRWSHREIANTPQCNINGSRELKKKNRKTPKSTLKRLTQNVSESQNIGAKTIKLSEENILENLCGLGLGKDYFS